MSQKMDGDSVKDVVTGQHINSLLAKSLIPYNVHC